MLRDCLFVNWALPLERLPAPPSPLRYHVQTGDEEKFVFASALLFRQEGLHFSPAPVVRLSHPQFNLRLCVLDEEGVPSVLFCQILVPHWMVFPTRLAARQPASGARFSFPWPSREPHAESWRWTVYGKAVLDLSAGRGTSAPAPGPRFGSWQANVDHIRQRPRGYVRTARGLDRIETSHPGVEVWPMKVEVGEATLLSKSLPLSGEPSWPAPHAAWLCPEIPMVFELGGARKVRLPRQVPAPG